MEPNLKKAATKAIDTLIHFEADPADINPFIIYNQLPNVVLVSCDEDQNVSYLCEFLSSDKNRDAVTLVNKEDGTLRYIVVYDPNLPPYKLRFALARELGHVILEHDGSNHEDIWTEEANCFAYHFLCPTPLFYQISEPHKINYRPQRNSLSGSMKDSRIFDSIEHMKLFIVEEQNRINRYIGLKGILDTEDVKLHRKEDYESLTGWKNFREVVLNGKTVGFCGE
jgi:Zn-dependent peptidase ImmA (M78 family)